MNELLHPRPHGNLFKLCGLYAKPQVGQRSNELSDSDCYRF
jgi:hypothetical protein